MSQKSYTKMSDHELARISLSSLNRIQRTNLLMEISDRKRKMKRRLSEFDDVIRTISTLNSRV